MSIPPLIILTGPTGVGKSETAILLAQRIGAEIISADSMQVYRFFDIGAAKPSLESRKKIPHHLIDIVRPEEEYNANFFRQDAEAIITDIHKKGKTPLVVGGTGLYIKTLTHGLECAIKPNVQIRDKIKKEIKTKGTEKMHEELAKIDPISADAINPRDWIRIERAMEIYRITGRPMSEFHKKDKEWARPQYRVLTFVLNMKRHDLYAKIERRVDFMLESGLVGEVQDLLEKGYLYDLKPFSGLGYKQVVSYLKGKDDYEDMEKSIKQGTRKYAKRQLTWCRRIEDAVWVDIEKDDNKEDVVQKILHHIPSNSHFGF